jgi:hypothetical protein
VIAASAQVEHAEYGMGKVLAVLGEIATVDFFGEALDVTVSDLILKSEVAPAAASSAKAQAPSDIAFRKSLEAVNLGVVPSDPEQLISLTIGGGTVAKSLGRLLSGEANAGTARIFLGYYGSGKSHHLQLVRSVALRHGWVTASVELDPKAADPAKPATVYKELLGSLQFPEKADGHKSVDFIDLVKEIRDNWSTIRDLPYFRSSPWFRKGLEALLYLPHRRDDQDYVSAVSWLAGQVKQISVVRSLSWRAGLKDKIPPLPQTKDNGLIYAYNLVVVNEVVKALGYKGLAIIIDEAEHVRGYSLNRYIKANNFFDILARCANVPLKDLKRPHCDIDVELPPFWKEGPHFALFVALTEGEDTRDLERKMGEMSVLIHDREQVMHLEAPNPDEYETWCSDFLQESARRLGPSVDLLNDTALCRRLAAAIRQHFEATPTDDMVLRNWTKLAGFAPAVLMAHGGKLSADELLDIVDNAASEVAGNMMPWDD